MEEAKLQVREWAKLKLVGQPLLTGRALWVALRPLPRLVHIYHNTTLRALLRFPEDPVFLLLTPLQDNTCDLEDVKRSTSEPNFSSLFVITLDGRLWWIQRISSHESAHRPAKKPKQNLSKERTQDKWDLFEDCDIYKDTDLYHDNDVYAASDETSMGSVKTHLLCKVLNLQTVENAPRRVRIESVQAKAWIGKFHDACLASAGPNNLIAVVSSSRNPIILNGASLLSTDFASALTVDCHLNKETRPSCLLFATIQVSKQRSQLEGLYLSSRFFNALARGFVGATPKHLLLQGNTLGEVHVFSVDSSNRISSPMLLCDLQEPIFELIAFPLCEASDALLVVSSHGFLVAINASQSEYKGTPLLTSASEPSLERLFRIDLRDALTLHSWRVNAPVVSVAVYEAGQVCILSASTMYLVSLLDNVSTEPTQISSHGSLTREMKKSFVCKSIPLFGVIVALTEGGPVVPSMDTGSLVALTSRGRVVTLRISEKVRRAPTECFIVTEPVKTWKPKVNNRDEDVTVLLDEIAVTDSCTKALEAMKASTDCALSELALALRLAYDILSSRYRDPHRAPYQSLTMPMVTSLHCNLEAKPVVTTVDTKRLCFRPAPIIKTQNLHPCFAESLSNMRLRVKVTLSNHGSVHVSPYWVLLLDVHASENSSRDKMFLSRAINDGYGLAPHASSAVDFEISCPGNSANALDVHVFLCHIHEHHDEVLQALTFSDLRTSEFDKERCEAKYLSQPMKVECGKQKSPLHAYSKAACVLLSRCRVDILSLLKQPHKVHQSLDFLNFQPQWVRGGAQKIGNPALRTFLGKFQLRFRRVRNPGAWTSPTSKEWWTENGLDEVLKCCALSTDGRELSGADVRGNTMLLALNFKHHEGENLLATEILISASCPLMGFMVREAVLERLKRQSRSWRMLKADFSSPFQSMDQVLITVMSIEEELNHLEQEVVKNFEYQDLAGQIYSIYERTMGTYRKYRENDASNPFWGFIRQT